MNANVRLLQWDIGVEKLRVYRAGSNFFLTDSNDEYLGNIEFSKVENKFATIGHIYSKITQGFYSIMFSAILTEPNIDYILSDVSLSDPALSAYGRLAKSNMLLVGVFTNEGIKDFSKDLVLSDSSYRVVVHEKKKGVLEYAFNDFRDRYNISESFKTAMDNGDHSVDYYLFNQEIIV